MKKKRTDKDYFIDEKGNCFLVHCPNCKMDSYALMTAGGQCSWCYWKKPEEKK